MNSNQSLQPFTLWALLADTIGIFFAVLFIKNQIDGAIADLKFPVELNFYFLFFWAFFASMFGGFLWNIFNRAVGMRAYLGGRRFEPRRKETVLWSVIPNLVVALVLVILNLEYSFVPMGEQIFLYATFLLGTVIGSMMFYDLPISQQVGFRNYFNEKHMTHLMKEFLLVVIWSTLLSTGFLALNFIKFLFFRDSAAGWMFITSFLRQTGLCVGLSTLAVTFFLLAFPEQPRMETARGVVAGLFLRIGFFFGLLLA